MELFGPAVGRSVNDADDFNKTTIFAGGFSLVGAHSNRLSLLGVF